MFRPFLLWWSVINLLAPALSIQAWAEDTDLATTNLCKSASDKEVIILSCSKVISMSHDPRLLERAFNRRGLAYEATGKFNDAVNDHSQVIRLNPKIAGYFDNRMRAYKALGMLDLALKDSEIAVSMAPTYSFVFQGRGAVRFERGEYFQAIADYTTALGIDHANAGLLVQRGRALLKVGRTGDAIRDFSEAHEVDPAFVPALRERGLAWAQLRDVENARPDLQAALAANASDDEVASALRALDGQASTPANAASTPNSERAEAEARRKLAERDEAERAQQEAAKRLKAERLARDRTEAQRLREDAADFVKNNRDDPKLMDHLQLIAELGASLQGSEPAAVERAMSLMSADLSSDPIYAAYAERRRADKAREDERNLAVAISTLRIQRGFLMGEIVKDPTGEETPVLLSLVKQADAALAAPELASARRAVGAIDTQIAKAKMTDRYDEAKRAAPVDKASQ